MTSAVHPVSLTFGHICGNGKFSLHAEWDWEMFRCTEQDRWKCDITDSYQLFVAISPLKGYFRGYEFPISWNTSILQAQIMSFLASDDWLFI